MKEEKDLIFQIISRINDQYFNLLGPSFVSYIKSKNILSTLSIRQNKYETVELVKNERKNAFVKKNLIVQ